MQNVKYETELTIIKSYRCQIKIIKIIVKWELK